MSRRSHLSQVAIRSVVLIAGMLLATQLLGEDRVHIWLKAFIPKNVSSNPGYIRPVPDRPGQFMLPDPFFADQAYLTDNREFNSDPNASARLTTDFTIVLPDSGAAGLVKGATGKYHFPNPTEKLNAQTGATTARQSADLSVDAMGGPHEVPGKIQVIFQVSARNPLAIQSGIRPVDKGLSLFVAAIDYSVDMIYDYNSGDLKLKGTFGKFPAFEGYVSKNGAPPVKLIQLAPSGSDVISLFDFGLGMGQQVVETTVNIGPRSIKGTWQSIDPAKRFRLEIGDATVKFTELNSSGASHARDVPLIPPNAGGSTYRVERPNTDTGTLTFLGFSPTIQTEILARAPRPSSLTIVRQSDGTIAARWSGLLVIKDAQGRFKELKQPGEGPIKDYVFTRVP